MTRIPGVLALFFLVSITLCIQNDVVFVIDISGSLSQENLNYSVDLLYDVTEFLTIGPSDIKISIVTFSNTSVVRHNFNNLSTQSDVLSALQSLKSLTTAGGTKTYLALDESHDLLTQASSGMRSGANKTVVVLTDGRSDNLLLTRASATTLHNDGIEVFSVGVGTEVFYDKTELYAIASDPDSYYQHDMENFIHLCNMVPTLVSKLDPSLSAITLAPDCVTTTTTTASPKKGKVTVAPDTTTVADTTTTTADTTTTTVASTTTTAATTTTSAATTTTTAATITTAAATTSDDATTTVAATTTSASATTTAAGGTSSAASNAQSQSSTASGDSSSSIPIIVVGATASLLLLSSIPGGYFLYKAALRRKIRLEEKEEEVENAIQPYEHSVPKHLGPGKPAWQA
ncbi:uncharacterized protein LOC111126950 [Crassostrea virginica]